MAIQSRIPAWEISWTVEPGELKSVGQKKSDDLTNKTKNSLYNVDYIKEVYYVKLSGITCTILL